MQDLGIGRDDAEHRDERAVEIGKLEHVAAERLVAHDCAPRQHQRRHTHRAAQSPATALHRRADHVPLCSRWHQLQVLEQRERGEDKRGALRGNGPLVILSDLVEVDVTVDGHGLPVAPDVGVVNEYDSACEVSHPSVGHAAVLERGLAQHDQLSQQLLGAEDEQEDLEHPRRHETERLEACARHEPSRRLLLEAEAAMRVQLAVGVVQREIDLDLLVLG
eukprot:6180711-Prymnesium_polylepis.1